MEILRKSFRLVSSINQLAYILMGMIFCVLSVIVFYDVIARYFFNSPTKFGFDLSIWLTATAAFLSGGYLMEKDHNIRVDIFYEKFSEKTKAFLDIISTIFIFLMVISFIWLGGQQVLSLYIDGDVSSTGFNIHVWIKWIIVPLGGLLLGLQTLVNLIKHIYFLVTGAKWEEAK